MRFETEPGVIDTQPFFARQNNERCGANEEKNTGAQPEILPKSARFHDGSENRRNERKHPGYPSTDNFRDRRAFWRSQTRLARCRRV